MKSTCYYLMECSAITRSREVFTTVKEENTISKMNENVKEILKFLSGAINCITTSVSFFEYFATSYTMKRRDMKTFWMYFLMLIAFNTVDCNERKIKGWRRGRRIKGRMKGSCEHAKDNRI